MGIQVHVLLYDQRRVTSIVSASAEWIMVPGSPHDLQHPAHGRLIELLRLAVQLRGVKVHRDAIPLDENLESVTQLIRGDLRKVSQLAEGLPAVLQKRGDDILRSEGDE